MEPLFNVGMCVCVREREKPVDIRHFSMHAIIALPVVLNGVITVLFLLAVGKTSFSLGLISS